MPNEEVLNELETKSIESLDDGKESYMDTDTSEDEETIEIEDTGEEPEDEEEAEAEETPAAEEKAAKPTSKKKPTKQTAEGKGLDRTGYDSIGKKNRAKTYDYGSYLDPETGEMVQMNRENSQHYKDYLELIASVKTHKVLYGTLTSVRGTDRNDVFAEVTYGDFTVVIPAEKFIDISLQAPEVQKAIAEGSAETKAYKLTMAIKGQLGVKVPFVVRYVNERENKVIGDKFSAMNKLARRYFVKKGNKEPILGPGKAVEAQVVASNRAGLWVEACGAETFIPSREVSWTRSSDVSRDYPSGSKIRIMIQEVHSKKIEQGKHFVNIIELKASSRILTENPNIKYYNSYEVGSTGIATVTQIMEKGIFVAFPNGITMYCQFPDGMDNPEIGDTCLVKVTQKYEEEHHFLGYINRILKSN